MYLALSQFVLLNIASLVLLEVFCFEPEAPSLGDPGFVNWFWVLGSETFDWPSFRPICGAIWHARGFASVAVREVPGVTGKFKSYFCL